MVSTKLQELEAFLEKHAPDVLVRARLRSPASPRQCQQLATALGIRALPSDTQALFCWHDGQEGASSILAESSDLGGWRLMPTAKSLTAILAGRSGRLENWRVSYLPFLESGGGDMCVIDVRTGSLEEWSHEGEPVAAVAESLEDFFSNHIEAWREEEVD